MKHAGDKLATSTKIRQDFKIFGTTPKNFLGDKKSLARFVSPV